MVRICSPCDPGEDTEVSHMAAAGRDCSARRRGRHFLHLAHSLMKNLLFTFTYEEFFMQQTHPTHEDIFTSFRHTYFLGWFWRSCFFLSFG